MLRAERARWRQGIDWSTEYTVDHLYGYALTFRTTLNLRRDLIRAAGAAPGNPDL
ncbi:hypothetical protein [Streptacidiphilus sp. MAP5-3]|uniref:hypothetical protein n=1 Tax=unclassified Streptacidiphilus TaxID=2643834 RepID=UPI003512B80F